MQNLLQSIVLSPESEYSKDLLWTGDATLAEDLDLLEIKGFCSFNSYINAFDPSFWLKYTDVKTVVLKLTVKDSGVLRLIEESRTSKEQLAEQSFTSDEWQTIEFSVNLQELAADAFLYFQIEAQDGAVYLKDACFVSPEAAARTAKFACCFCTFRREQDIIANVDRITKFFTKRYGTSWPIELYVVDNGATLQESDFADMTNVHLIQNKNYGGSAGFTRAMIETCFPNDNDFTHVLLLDDDAVVEGHMIERVISICGNLNSAHKQLAIGASRFSIEQPKVQAVSLGSWSLGKSTAYGRSLDMSSWDNILLNSANCEANYLGWFFACLPISVITASNLPLPLFFQHDDVEYGLRNKLEYASCSGICVWHPSAESGKRAFSAYYHGRNDLLMLASCFPDITPSVLLKKIAKDMVSYASLWRFTELEAYKAGVKDFYKGIDSFKQVDPEALHLKLIKQYRYEVLDLRKISLVKEDICAPKIATPKKSRILGTLLPAKASTRFYDNDTAWNCLDLRGVRSLCFINGQDPSKSIVLRKSYLSQIKAVFYLLGQIFAVYARRSIFKEWIQRVSELETLDFWSDYLELKK